jgi:uncharacterized membrane protein
MKMIHEGRVWAWLQRELPGWVADGIITEESAVRLRERYPDPKREARPLGVIMVAVLGAALIGAGIISLLAYNWDQLERPARTVVSLLPLLITQVLAGLALTRWKHSTAAREAVCVGLIASIGIAISLIAQTYQIGGDFKRFMLTWFFLSLPAVYLLRSGFGYTLCQIGLFVWIWPDWFSRAEGHNLLYPLWLLFTLPYWFWIRRQGDVYRLQGMLLKWVLAIAVYWGSAFWLDQHIHYYWTVVYAIYFALGFLLDRQSGAADWRGRPFAVIGIIGTVALLIMLSMGVWSWGNSMRQLDLANVKVWVCIVAGLCWLALWGRAIVQKDVWRAVLGSLPFALLLVITLQWLVGWSVYYEWRSLSVQSSFTLYTLAVGAWLAFLGFMQHRLSILNLGLLIVGLLAVFRFFDDSYGFLLKGSVFIAVGVVFIVTNLMVSRRISK